VEHAILSTRLLRSVPLFSGLDEAELEAILKSPLNDSIEVESGTVVLEEHDLGDCMYVILSGSVDVTMRTVDGREVSIGTLRAGEYFGEQALLPGGSGRRNASIRTMTSCSLFRISKEHALKGIRTNSRVGATPEQLAMATREERVWHFLQGIRLFRGCNISDFSESSESFELIHCDPGQFIFKEGEAADAMFVVFEGSVENFVMDDDGKIEPLSTIGRGGYFGEQALLRGGSPVRYTNVRTDSTATIIKIDNDFFDRIVARDDKLRSALITVGKVEQQTIERLRGKVRYS
jgi:CRP-like cAMP-binding protein